MKKKQLVALALAGILTIQPAVPLAGNIVYAATLEELNEQLEELENQRDEIKQLISDSDTLTEKNSYAEQLSSINNEIKQVNSLIAKAEKEEQEEQVDNEDEGSDKDVEDEVDDEQEVEIIKPNTDKVKDEDVKVSDVTVSTDVSVSNNRVRTTEIYSINNQLEDCYYKPKFDEVPLLANRVLKLGKYAAAYQGFYDLGWVAPTKPKGSQSRALEILGYDYLLTDENYNVNTKKYTRKLIGSSISKETAIMNIYKALGLEQYNVSMYHERANYTAGTSPVASLLGRSTIEYTKVNQKNGSVSYVDTLDPYYTYVFVTRTDPELYMKKLSNDMNVSMSADKSKSITLAEFIKLCAQMMEFYGEPVLSDKETKQLLQIYGAEVPVGMEEDVESAWIYLKSRGVLNVNTTNLYSNLSKQDMFDILMCIKDRDSRTNYKEIQPVVTLNSTLVESGYFPQEVTVTQVDQLPVDGNVNYEDTLIDDYLIPISEYTTFVGITGEEVSTQFISDNPNTTGMQLEGAYYSGIVDDKYYHYIVPKQELVSSSSYKDGVYLRVDSLAAEDKPGAFYMEQGGGIYKLKSTEKLSGESVSYFIRRPFNETEYIDYVDNERRTGINDFDYDSWAASGMTSSRVGEETEEDKPDVPDLGNWSLDDWEGISVYKHAITIGEWIKDDATGKWRYFTTDEDGTNREYLYSDAYYISKSGTGNVADSIYLFDSDGFMVTGWYQDGRLWCYFKEDGSMCHDETVEIDGTSYTFDSCGYWIDMIYNVPEDAEDDWGYLSNVSGQWQQSDSGKWWYLFPDGTYALSDVYKISDKYYCFDDEGWMLGGWQKINKNYYYFDKVDGYMLINTVTPDGYKVGANGRALGKLRLSFIPRTVRSLFAKAKEVFSPMITYADVTYSNFSSSNREYKVKVYLSLVKESVDDIKKFVSDNTNGQGRVTMDSNNNCLVIRSTLSAAVLSSQLTYKADSSAYSLISARQGIARLTSANSNGLDECGLLVPFDALVNAGVFLDLDTDQKTKRSGTELALTSVTTTPGADGKTIYSGFGRIRVNNSNKTILIGPTIYSLSDSTSQLFTWTSVDEDSNDLSYFLDEDKATESLYVDFRVAYGWTGNAIKFYRTNNGDDKSAGILVCTNSSVENNKNLATQYILNGNSKAVAGIRKAYIKTYELQGKKVITAANSYSLGNFAIIIKPNSSGTGDDLYIVNAYQKAAFESHSLSAPDDLSTLKSILPIGNTVPVVDKYCYRVKKINTSGLETISDSTVLEENTWYIDPDYGYVYVLPTVRSAPDKDYYRDYLNGSIDLSIVAWVNDIYDSSDIYDVAVPHYLSASYYGVTQFKFEVANETRLIPTFAGLSHFLYTNDYNVSKIMDLAVNSEDVAIYFGNSKLQFKDSNKMFYIAGITANGGQEAGTLKIDNGSSLRFVAIDQILPGSITGQNIKPYTIFTTVPDSLEFEVVSESDQKEVKSVNVSFGISDGTFDDWKTAITYNTWQFIEFVLYWIVAFFVQVFPLIGYTMSLVVLGFGILQNNKMIKWFCNHIFDPVKILTFGTQSIETIGGMKFFICVICVVLGFSLCIDGNIFKIIQWFLTFIDEYLGRLNVMR